jgi:hypothetical protein
MRESGVAWVLERAEVNACEACGFSKVVVVGGMDCTAPAPGSSLLQQAKLLFGPRLNRCLFLSDGADGSASRGRCLEGATMVCKERDGQIMVSVPLHGRAMHRRHDARKSGTRTILGLRRHFRYCDALPSNPLPRLRFAVLVQQSNPLPS